MVALVFSSGGNTDDGNDKLTDQHSKGAIDQQSATTEFLDGEERDRGAADVDEGGDETDHEWIADGLQLLEESGSELSQSVKYPQGIECASIDLHKR